MLRLLTNQIRNDETNMYSVPKYFVDLVKMIQLGHVFVVRWGVIYWLEYVSPRMMRHLIEFKEHLDFPMTSLSEFKIDSTLVQGYIRDFFDAFDADPQTSLLDNVGWLDVSRISEDDDASSTSDDSDVSEVLGIGENLFTHFVSEVVE